MARDEDIKKKDINNYSNQKWLLKCGENKTRNSIGIGQTRLTRGYLMAEDDSSQCES